MNLEKFTQKSQEAIFLAQQLAQDLNHQAIEPIHILLALLRQDEGVAPAIVTKVAGSTLALVEELQTELDRRPKVHGSNMEVGLAQPTTDVLRAAERYAKGMQDDYVSTEHILLGLTESSEGKRLASYGLTKDAILAALKTVRGSQRVTTADPEVHLPVPGKIRARPDRPGPQRQARPGHRARRRNPPHGADSLPAHQEQPGPDRRAGRGQNRHRRGPGPAHCQRRRARRPEEKASLPTGHELPGGRSQVPRRVRRTPQGRPQGNRRIRRAKFSSLWTKCTPWSARARPKAPWTPATCSSPCWRAANCT